MTERAEALSPYFSGDAGPPAGAMPDVAAYALRLGDDALVASHRLAEWVSHAPELEEDVALANIALDLLGQARALLSYAAQREDRGRDEDTLAYLRTDREFSNAALVELPTGDFGRTIARQLLFSTYQHLLYRELTDCRDETIAGVAGKAVKEVAYHRDHATQWTLRLGDGTAESNRRIQTGLADVWPYVAELFTSDALARRVADAGCGVDPAVLWPEWDAAVDEVLADATLVRPDLPAARTAGRWGLHTEHLGHMLAEMQSLHRAHEGASW